jgi:hypothetical protein
MSRSEPMSLEEAVAAHLAGRTPAVPESLRAEFHQAVVAHAVLLGLANEAQAAPPDDAGERRPPQRCSGTVSME